jgi:NAD(P)H-nitrite reductase large subunit
MHIVIVGNGVAGITCALDARDRDASARITVVSGETAYFYSRTALMYAFMDKMNRRDLEPFERDVWRKRNIGLVTDWVTDHDADKRELKLAGGRTISYDVLVLALGAAPNRPEWAGLAEAKHGVVNFVSMQDLDACESLVPASKRAVVVGGGLIGIELVECLVRHGIATTFLIREPYYWPAALSREEAQMVVAHLRDHGVNVVLDENVERIESSGGRVTGVTTASGKRFDADILGICIGVRANLERLRGWKDAPLSRRGIVVDDRFRTNLANVYACGDCCEIERPGAPPLVELIWYSARRHGALVARNTFGDDVAYVPPVFFNSSKFFHIEFTTVGDVETAKACTPTIFRHRVGHNVSQRIVHDGDRVIGFNMLGSRWDNEVLARWVAERRSPSYVLRHLAEAQHDVELGRVDLARFDESNIPHAKLGAPPHA